MLARGRIVGGRPEKRSGIRKKGWESFLVCVIFFHLKIKPHSINDVRRWVEGAMVLGAAVASRRRTTAGIYGMFWIDRGRKVKRAFSGIDEPHFQQARKRTHTISLSWSD